MLDLHVTHILPTIMSSVANANANPDGTLVQQVETAPARKQDCLSCRIVGTGTFATVGTYALWQSRAAAPGGPGQKKIVAGLGVGMLRYCSYVGRLTFSYPALIAGGVIRWFQ